MVKLFDSVADALAKIPNHSALRVEVKEQTICIVNFNDQIYAIQNSCPHLGESLSRGTVNYLGEIVCPWHSYRFNLKNGEESSRRCRDARVFKILIEADGVYLRL